MAGKNIDWEGDLSRSEVETRGMMRGWINRGQSQSRSLYVLLGGKFQMKRICHYGRAIFGESMVLPAGRCPDPKARLPMEWNVQSPDMEVMEALDGSRKLRRKLSNAASIGCR